MNNVTLILTKVPSTAFVVSSSLNVFVGVVTVNATIILDQLGRDDEDLANINDVIKPIFVVLFPHYCLGRGLVDLALLYRTYEVEFFSIFSIF